MFAKAQIGAKPDQDSVVVIKTKTGPPITVNLLPRYVIPKDPPVGSRRAALLATTSFGNTLGGSPVAAANKKKTGETLTAEEQQQQQQQMLLAAAAAGLPPGTMTVAPLIGQIKSRHPAVLGSFQWQHWQSIGDGSTPAIIAAQAAATAAAEGKPTPLQIHQLLQLQQQQAQQQAQQQFSQGRLAAAAATSGGLMFGKTGFDDAMVKQMLQQHVQQQELQESDITGGEDHAALMQAVGRKNRQMKKKKTSAQPWYGVSQTVLDAEREEEEKILLAQKLESLRKAEEAANMTLPLSKLSGKGAAANSAVNKAALAFSQSFMLMKELGSPTMLGNNNGLSSTSTRGNGAENTSRSKGGGITTTATVAPLSAFTRTASSLALDSEGPQQVPKRKKQNNGGGVILEDEEYEDDGDDGGYEGQGESIKKKIARQQQQQQYQQQSKTKKMMDAFNRKKRVLAAADSALKHRPAITPDLLQKEVSTLERQTRVLINTLDEAKQAIQQEIRAPHERPPSQVFILDMFSSTSDPKVDNLRRTWERKISPERQLFKTSMTHRVGMWHSKRKPRTAGSRDSRMSGTSPPRSASAMGITAESRYNNNNSHNYQLNSTAAEDTASFLASSGSRSVEMMDSPTRKKFLSQGLRSNTITRSAGSNKGNLHHRRRRGGGNDYDDGEYEDDYEDDDDADDDDDIFDSSFASRKKATTTGKLFTKSNKSKSSEDIFDSKVARVSTANSSPEMADGDWLVGPFLFEKGPDETERVLVELANSVLKRRKAQLGRKTILPPEAKRVYQWLLSEVPDFLVERTRVSGIEQAEAILELESTIEATHRSGIHSYDDNASSLSLTYRSNSPSRRAALPTTRTTDMTTVCQALIRHIDSYMINHPDSIIAASLNSQWKNQPAAAAASMTSPEQKKKKESSGAAFQLSSSPTMAEQLQSFNNNNNNSNSNTAAEMSRPGTNNNNNNNNNGPPSRPSTTTAARAASALSPSPLPSRGGQRSTDGSRGGGGGLVAAAAAAAAASSKTSDLGLASTGQLMDQQFIDAGAAPVGGHDDDVRVSSPPLNAKNNTNIASSSASKASSKPPKPTPVANRARSVSPPRNSARRVASLHNSIARAVSPSSVASSYQSINNSHLTSPIILPPLASMEYRVPTILDRTTMSDLAVVAAQLAHEAECRERNWNSKVKVLLHNREVQDSREQWLKLRDETVQNRLKDHIEKNAQKMAASREKRTMRALRAQQFKEEEQMRMEALFEAKLMEEDSIRSRAKPRRRVVPAAALAKSVTPTSGMRGRERQGDDGVDNNGNNYDQPSETEQSRKSAAGVDNGNKYLQKRDEHVESLLTKFEKIQVRRTGQRKTTVDTSLPSEPDHILPSKPQVNPYEEDFAHLRKKKSTTHGKKKTTSEKLSASSPAPVESAEPIEN